MDYHSSHVLNLQLEKTKLIYLEFMNLYIKQLAGNFSILLQYERNLG